MPVTPRRRAQFLPPGRLKDGDEFSDSTGYYLSGQTMEQLAPRLGLTPSWGPAFCRAPSNRCAASCKEVGDEEPALGARWYDGTRVPMYSGHCGRKLTSGRSRSLLCKGC